MTTPKNKKDKYVFPRDRYFFPKISTMKCPKCGMICGEAEEHTHKPKATISWEGLLFIKMANSYGAKNISPGGISRSDYESIRDFIKSLLASQRKEILGIIVDSFKRFENKFPNHLLDFYKDWLIDDLKERIK